MIEFICPNDQAMVGVPDEAVLAPSCPACGNIMIEADILTKMCRRAKVAWQILKTGQC